MLPAWGVNQVARCHDGHIDLTSVPPVQGLAAAQ